MKSQNARPADSSGIVVNQILPDGKLLGEWTAPGLNDGAEIADRGTPGAIAAEYHVKVYNGPTTGTALLDRRLKLTAVNNVYPLEWFKGAEKQPGYGGIGLTLDGNFLGLT